MICISECHEFSLNHPLVPIRIMKKGQINIQSSALDLSNYAFSL